MFRSDLKQAARTLTKHRGYALMSIAGMALALACAFLLLLAVTYETSFDRFWPNADRIFRVSSSWEGRRSGSSASVSGDLLFEGQFPEVEKTARLFTYSWREKALISGNGKSFFEERFFLADPALLDILTVEFLRGDPAAALAGNSGLVVSESAAARFFGRENPLGRVLTVRNLGQTEMTVTGVIKDMPPNSHVHCDFIAPFAAGETLFWPGFAGRNNSYIYLLLRPDASATELEKKLPVFVSSRLGDNPSRISLHLHPLTSIHLSSMFADEIEPGGNVKTVRLFVLLALIILAVAVVNFVNLTTARSIGRGREIGIKKVAGARRSELVRQFLVEAVLFALLALPAALVLARLLLPLFNGALDASLSLGFKGNGPLFAGAALLTVATGLASGFVPAFWLSGFRPTEVLKGKFTFSPRGVFVRRALVVFQFAASIVLMIGALVVSSQMRYIRSGDPGFGRDGMVIVPIKDEETMARYDALKTAFLRSPAVLKATGSDGIPSRIRGRQAVVYEGAAGEEEKTLFSCFVDFDFLPTYGIALASGRDFSRTFGSDESRAYLINETAARSFGWAEPVGKRIQFSNRDLMKAEFEPGEVIGVVRDFHFQSLREKIEPLVMKVRKAHFTNIAVRLVPGKIREGLDFLEASWKDVLPGRPFEFSFLDRDIDLLYRDDRRTGRIFGYATAFSLVIAGLGLFGLASFSAARRTKEVGIRKVLGASPAGLARLLSLEFVQWVLFANVVAWPLGYYLMHRWLRNFAYRTSLAPWAFLVAALAAVALALSAVGFKAFKTASADPVKALRYE